MFPIQVSPGTSPLVPVKSVAWISQLCHGCHKVQKLVGELLIASLANSAAFFVSCGWSDIYDRGSLSPLWNLSYCRAVKIFINNVGNWEGCSLGAKEQFAVLFFHLCYSKPVLCVCPLWHVSNYFQTYRFSQIFVALNYFSLFFSDGWCSYKSQDSLLILTWSFKGNLF